MGQGTKGQGKNVTKGDDEIEQGLKQQEGVGMESAEAEAEAEQGGSTEDLNNQVKTKRGTEKA